MARVPKHQRRATSPPVVERPRLQPEVSDHAVLRYLERILEIDVDAIRAEILGEGRGAMIFLMENGVLPIAGGGRLVVRNRRVVTVKRK